MRVLSKEDLIAWRKQWLREGRLPARVGKFAIVGGTCGLVQLSILHALVLSGVEEHLSNFAAFAASVQLNFLLSQFFTWRDRWTSRSGPATLARRLVLFNASATTTGLVNQGVFALMNVFISYLPAAACGIGVAAFTNFALNDRLVFRTRDATADPSAVGSG